MHVLSLVIRMKHFITSIIWKGKSKLFQECVQKELHITITGYIMQDGME
jgi:hypothetical protein